MNDSFGGSQAASSGDSALDWFKAASPLIGSALSGGSKTGSAQAMPIFSPNTAYQNTTSLFDSSKWTVSTGNASANAGETPWLLLIGVGLLVLFLRKYG